MVGCGVPLRQQNLQRLASQLAIECLVKEGTDSVLVNVAVTFLALSSTSLASASLP